MSSHPLAQLVLVRFREFAREPEAVFWTFIFPILIAAGLGIAFRSRPPEMLVIGVVGHELAAAFEGAEGVDAELFPDAAAGRLALRNGDVALLVERGPDGGVLYRYDDTNPEGRSARAASDRAVQVAAGRADPVASSDALVREPGSRYIDFLIPGLLGMTLMGGSIWSMGFSIVDARRRKLLKRLMATPMPRHYFLLSYLLARLAMLVVEVGAILLFATLVFGVPLRGSFVLLVGLCLTGALSFGAIGLLISTRARTIEAVSGLMNFVMLPMWVLSGVFFSSQRFPDAVQPVIKALPLTALIDGLRANMLQGAGVVEVAPQFGVLGVWLLACFAVALKLFRWR
jgi:ABC-type polysaccharide/polyol phosphate export permease